MSDTARAAGGSSRLGDRRCAPSTAGTAALGRAECEQLLAELAPGWELADDSRSLRRAFRFADFYRTMSFLNCIAHIANVEDHHPDLTVGYGQIGLTYSTHSIKGLSENDFICAAKIDRIPLT